MELFSKKYGFICIGLTKPGRKPYLYFSPNGTPWASTFYLGPDKDERVRAKVRKYVFGHNFDVYGYDQETRSYNYDILTAIRELVSIEYRHYLYYRKRLLEQ